VKDVSITDIVNMAVESLFCHSYKVNNCNTKFTK